VTKFATKKRGGIQKSTAKEGGEMGELLSGRGPRGGGKSEKRNFSPIKRGGRRRRSRNQQGGGKGGGYEQPIMIYCPKPICKKSHEGGGIVFMRKVHVEEGVGGGGVFFPEEKTEKQWREKGKKKRMPRLPHRGGRFKEREEPGKGHCIRSVEVTRRRVGWGKKKKKTTIRRTWGRGEKEEVSGKFTAQKRRAKRANEGLHLDSLVKRGGEKTASQGERRDN